MPLTDEQFEADRLYGKREGRRPPRRRGPRIARRDFDRLHDVCMRSLSRMLGELEAEQERERKETR